MISSGRRQNAELANLRLFVEDPSLQADPRRSVFEPAKTLRRSLSGATGGLRSFRSCVGEQAWRLLLFDVGERREGEFGQAVEQRETWGGGHTPEVSRGPHGRNR